MEATISRSMIKWSSEKQGASPGILEVSEIGNSDNASVHASSSYGLLIMKHESS